MTATQGETLITFGYRFQEILWVTVTASIAFRSFNYTIAAAVTVCGIAASDTLTIVATVVAVLTRFADAVVVTRIGAAINGTVGAVFSAFTGSITTTVMSAWITACFADAIVRT